MSEIDIKVSKELVGPIIEAKIQAAIVGELSNAGDLVGKVVAQALSQKVKASDHSYNKITFIEKVCKDTIRAAAEQAVKEWASEHQAQITAEFLRQLKQPTTARKVVRAMVGGMAEVAGSKWKFSVKLPD